MSIKIIKNLRRLIMRWNEEKEEKFERFWSFLKESLRKSWGRKWTKFLGLKVI